MSVMSISQTWRNTIGKGRAWTVALSVSASDLTADETAALAPVIAAIEQYTSQLDGEPAR